VPLEAELGEDVLWLALCCWKEARGQTAAAKLGQCWVVRNRARSSLPRWPRRILDVVTQPYQFSALTAPGDPNLAKWPKSLDPSWGDCISAARECLSGNTPDPTAGATFYYSDPLSAPPPGWGGIVSTVEIDGLHFYKLA